jgi:polysaccharide biosynthesis protein PslH
MKSLRILQLCHKPPRPSKDGGCRAMDAMTRGLLSCGHQVKVLTIATEKHPFSPTEIDDAYLEATEMESVVLDTAVNGVDAFSSILTGESYNISRFYASEFDRLLTHILQRQVFDLVIFESLFVAPYLRTVRRYCDGPCVLRAHNVEHRIWEQLAVETEGLTKRIYLKHLAERLKDYEVNALQDFDFVAAITAEDKRIIKAIGCSCPVFTLPFGLDADELPKPTSNPSNHVFHLGAMDWEPNIQGVRWFIESVWPEVLREIPDCELRLAGRNFPSDFMEPHPSIHVEGEIECAWKFLSGNGVMIIPLLSGSGMRIKALEGMACGRPIVTTSLGVEGIQGEDGRHFLIADDALTFARKIIEILLHPQRAVELGDAASAFAREHFDNKSLVRNMLDVLDSTFAL